MRRPVRIVIVGAGLGGIAAAVKLKRAGFEDFTVYEKADGPGGVWWQNTYPGCEVDIPSHAYSFSFMPYDWSGTHAKQAEVQRYAEDVIDRFGLRPHFRFGTGVDSASWDDDAQAYVVRLADGSETRAGLLVSAVGMLSHPKLPQWPGMDTFTGPMFHTSRFDHTLDLSGKRVAMVGTGSSGCQLAPRIVEQVGRLDIYQREPGHVFPKPDRLFDDRERARFRRSRLAQRRERLRLFRGALGRADTLRTGSTGHRHTEEFFARYLAKTVRDPAVRAALTPDYPYGCKRPIYATTWYPMFNRDNVELVPHAVVGVAPDGLIDDTGTKRPADVVILSTGFQAANYLATLPVSGPGGRSLREAWQGDPWAFLGLTVPGFPNFAMMYGPNTNGGFSVMTQHEIQADVVVRLARRLRRRRVVDTRPGVASRVDRRVQERIAVHMSAMAGGCHNYYHSTSGKNVTQWPLSHTAYRLAVRVVIPLGLTTGGSRRSDRATGQRLRSGHGPAGG